MSFLNRKKQMTWTSPEGSRFVLKSKNVLSAFKHDGEIYELFGLDGDTFIDKSVSGKTIPLEVIFFGNDHDTDANNFETALREIGVSQLQLAYGNELKVNVITVRRTYSLVDSVNQTKFLIQFHEVIEQAFPKTEGTDKNWLLNLVSNFKDSLASNFANGLNIRNIFEETAIGSTFFEYVDTIDSFARPIISESLESVSLLTNIGTSIQTNLELLTSDPFTIAKQMAILVGIPAGTVSDVNNLVTYTEGLVVAATESPFDDDSLITNEKKNDIYTNALVGGAAINSLAEGLVNSEYKTRSEVFGAIERLENSYITYRGFLDDMQAVYEGSNSLDAQYLQTGDLSVPINDIVQQTAGALIDIAFSLRREFIFTVTKDTNMFNIVAKYYPDEFALDEENGNQDTLDFFSALNNLTNDEILLIPKGREIKVLI